MTKSLLLLLIMAACSALIFGLSSGCAYRIVPVEAIPSEAALAHTNNTDVYARAASKPAALLPRSQILSSRSYSQVRFSPDGRWLSFRQRSDDAADELFVAPPSNLRAAISLSQQFNMPMTEYQWSFLPNIVLVKAHHRGDTRPGMENPQWYQVNVNTLKASAITDVDTDSKAFITTFANNPSNMLLTTPAKDATGAKALRVNLLSGEAIPLANSKRWSTVLYDQHFQLRVGCKPNPAAQVECYDVSGPRPLFIQRLPKPEVAADDFQSFLAQSGEWVYALPTSNTELTRIQAYRFTDKKSLTLATATQGTLSLPIQPYSDLYLHEYLFKTLGVTDAILTPQHAHWLKQRLTFLGEILGTKHFDILSRTLDDSQWLLYVDDITGSPRYVLLDTTHFKLRTLFYQTPELQTHLADPMMPIEAIAQDGSILLGYFSAPLDQIIHTGDPHFLTLKPLPTVLLVQGNRWNRNHYQYNKRVQWLTNRGYGVLQVNHRQRGAQPVSAAIHTLTAQRHQDLLDALDWSIRKGLVDPEKVAIIGGREDDYIAATSMSLAPERFACGVDIARAVDSVKPIRLAADTRHSGIGTWHTPSGNPNADSGKQGSHPASFLAKTERIRNPLLILQQANELNVNQPASTLLASALQRHQGQIAYAVFADPTEDDKPSTNTELTHALIEHFLAKQLGGRAEPIPPQQLAHAKVQIIAGATWLPSLNQAQTKAKPHTPKEPISVETLSSSDH